MTYVDSFWVELCPHLAYLVSAVFDSDRVYIYCPTNRFVLIQTVDNRNHSFYTHQNQLYSHPDPVSYYNICFPYFLLSKIFKFLSHAIRVDGYFFFVINTLCSVPLSPPHKQNNRFDNKNETFWHSNNNFRVIFTQIFTNITFHVALLSIKLNFCDFHKKIRTKTDNHFFHSPFSI